MTNRRAISAQNRRAWDEIAGVRHQNTARPAEFYASGGSILDARATTAAGQVRGRRLLHLQCSTGEETLSWAVLGAEACGVDLSPKQIELARQMAQSAGLAVRFEAVDVYDLPADLQAGRFDLVYTGGGSLVWLPDLEGWAAVVVRALRPGGRLILLEEHPLAACLEIGADGLALVDDYFRRGKALEGTGWFHFIGGENARENKYEFNWPLGDVVSALARWGMRIEQLTEYPAGDGWRFGERAEQVSRLPGDYLLVAVKA